MAIGSGAAGLSGSAGRAQRGGRVAGALPGSRRQQCAISDFARDGSGALGLGPLRRRLETSAKGLAMALRRAGVVGGKFCRSHPFQRGFLPAANWVAIGWTRGYAKAQGQFIYHGQPKEIYVYVIEKRIRQILLEDPAQGLLTREFLLAQRPTGNPQPQARRKPMSETLQSWTPKLPPHWELSAEDLEHVRQDLNEFTAQFAGTFRRIEPSELCHLYLQGLLSDTERKNVEAIALELEGPERVRNLQRFITEYEWDEPWMREQHWKLCAQTLADEQGVWSIDASEFPKKGEPSE